MLVAERYRLGEPLGRGAMGEVWRGTDQVMGRPVAVKLLAAGGVTTDAADAERFCLEAQTAARVSHPNLVRVYDFGAHDGRPYLVMELVDGRSLAEERDRHTVFAPEEAADIAAQMAAGLAAAHRHRVVHRDIKPGNVMLTADRTAKITDFGIARFTDTAARSLTATGKIIGSAAYLAPERAVGRCGRPSSDVYALGCVLYELLTGRPPFVGTSLAVVQQHVDAAPTPPRALRPALTGPLADYVLRLLAKDPEQRPTAEEAALWLAAGRYDDPAPETVVPHRQTPLAPTAVLPVAKARPARPVKGVAALTGAAVLAGALGLGAGLTSSPGGGAPSAPAPADRQSTSVPEPGGGHGGGAERGGKGKG
ncbi:serine/threonine-protein kinase [Streptomyces sp. B93]|uniref:serine/threonine-protein kinase n=1 Tax=Streptomyces sp. B93 TaxID=2824875 RepID=UPI0027E55473|nr:serine/threonine-protein kinase [Streptomyces sp. B93]